MTTPAYVVQHTYLGEGPSRMHHRRPILMMASHLEDNPRETDCSSRALATLVIAWVGAALVASVLLKWTHMWVALAVLTALFLVACCYAACDARRVQARALAREVSRQEERRRRREQQLESISEGIDNFPEIIEPPEYQTYWVADLPPSYTAAVGTQTGNETASRTQGAEENPASVPAPRLSNPPPYTVAVQSEPLFLPIVQNGNSNNEHTSTAGQNTILQENGQTSSQTGRVTPGNPPVNVDHDKIEEGEENGQNTRTPSALTRTQYFTSILFGRNMRRAHNNNTEQNTSPVGTQTNLSGDRQHNETMNQRNRDENVANDSSSDGNNNNNHNHNHNTNNGSGPPPAYPHTRLSSGIEMMATLLSRRSSNRLAAGDRYQILNPQHVRRDADQKVDKAMFD